MHLLAPFNKRNLKDIFRAYPKLNPILFGDALPPDPWNNHPIDLKLAIKVFMKETFKNCPEVPTSCPNVDDISTFSTETTDLPKNHCFWKILFYVEKNFFLLVLDKPNAFQLF